MAASRRRRRRTQRSGHRLDRGGRESHTPWRRRATVSVTFVVRQHHPVDGGEGGRLVLREPCQLGDGEAGDRHQTAASRPLRVAEPRTQRRRLGCRGGVVPQLGGAQGSTLWSTTTRPCCWPATEMATTLARWSPTWWNASASAAHQACGSCSETGGDVGGCEPRPVATSLPVSSSRSSTLVDWVNESTPATSGTAVNRTSRT